MKYFLFCIIIITASFGLVIPSNHIVSDKWLNGHLDNKNIVIIDARPAKAYNKNHILHAINIPFEQWFKGKVGNVSHMYDTPRQVEKLLDKTGVTSRSTVVFYSAGHKKRDYCDAIAGLYNIWLYGFKRSVILNGGYAKWKFGNNKTTSHTSIQIKSNYEVNAFNNKIIASLNDVINAIYHKNIQLLDVRNYTYFVGKDTDKLLVRHGRIPTAKLSSSALEVKKVNNYYQFISAKQSKILISNGGYGVNITKPIVIYCNTGHNARGVWFVLKFIDNLKSIKVYDGSMLEYSKTPLPVLRGEPMSF